MPEEQPPPVLHYATHQEESLVLIARFNNAFEAGLAQLKLESEGIQVYPEDAMVTGIDAYTGQRGSRVRVRPEDAPRAVDLLRATPARKALVGPFAVPDVLTCPACASTNVAPRPVSKLLTILLLGLPVLFTKATLRCAACGHVWSPAR